MTPADSDLNLSAIYLRLELANGAVADGWSTTARACSAAGLDALVDRQQLVLAEQVQRVENTSVRIARRPATFSEAEVASMEAWFSKAITRRFAGEMVASACETGKLLVPHPLDDGTAWCNTSICGGAVVFLRFQGGSEPFYVIQHNFAVEALYFPLREALVYLNDCLVPKVKLRRLFLQLLRFADESLAYFRTAERRWAGLLVANDSPYHFFYFQAPGVAIACFPGSDHPPAFHTLPGEHYLDVATAFGLGGPTRVHSTPAALQSALVEEQSFVFSVGVRPINWLNPQRLKMVDGALLAACRRDCAVELADIGRTYDLVLWAGISSGKRAWRQETEAVSLFVNRVAPRFKRVLLLLDGWTATLARSSEPHLYAGDLSAAARVRAAVASNVDCAGLIGAEPVRKIGLGSAVDFFIASHGTASLYVARICGRPGVSHISNAARSEAVAQHVHQSTRLVPEDMVTDLAQTDSRDKFRLDYSIDPDKFATFAEQVFVASRREGISKPLLASF